MTGPINPVIITIQQLISVTTRREIFFGGGFIWATERGKKDREEAEKGLKRDKGGGGEKRIGGRKLPTKVNLFLP